MKDQLDNIEYVQTGGKSDLFDSLKDRNDLGS